MSGYIDTERINGAVPARDVPATPRFYWPNAEAQRADLAELTALAAERLAASKTRCPGCGSTECSWPRLECAAPIYTPEGPTHV